MTTTPRGSTHVKEITVIDLATGERRTRYEYGYFHPRDDDPGNDWRITAYALALPEGLVPDQPA